MQNSLSDLNNHLFAQLERLGDEDLVNDDKKLAAEIERSKAIAGVSVQVVSNANLALQATKFMSGGDRLPVGQKMPVMLEDMS